MSFIKIDPDTNQIVQYPYTITDLKNDNPNTSFPMDISYELLSSFNVFHVIEESIPLFNEFIQKAEKGDVVNVDGVWKQVWNIVDLNDNEKEAKLQEKRQNATLTPSEFRIRLLRMDKLTLVENFLYNKDPSVKNTEAKILYSYATVFERNNPILIELAKEMGFTDKEMDNLFNIDY